jgi:hypothetical protein
MTRTRSDWPAAPDFHPEFGFLCPSARKRRGLRLATALLVTTLAIGATMGFAVEHRSDEVAPVAAAEQPLPGSTSAADPTRTRETCDEDLVKGLATYFLNINSRCGASKPHARHGARTANRVATVIIGRTQALPAVPAAAAVEPPAVDSGKAEGPESVAAAAPERTTSPKKPKMKPTALVLAASPAVGAYASVSRSGVRSYQSPSYQPQSYQPYGDAFRSGRSWRQWP